MSASAVTTQLPARQLAATSDSLRATAQKVKLLKPESATEPANGNQTNGESTKRDPVEPLRLRFTAGCRPTYLRKAPYFGRPEFRGLYDDREGDLLVAPREAADGDGPALPDEPRERVLSIPLAAGLYERLEKAAAGESLASYLGDVLADILGEDEAERPVRPA